MQIDIGVEMGMGRHCKSGHSPCHSIGYGFADQRVNAARSGGPLKPVRSFVALDPPWPTRSLAFILKLGLGPAIGRHARNLSRWLMRTPSFEQTQIRFVSEGADSSGQLTATIRLETGDQARATAAILGSNGPGRKGVTTISNHVRFDAAMRVLWRVLSETVTDSAANSDVSDTERI